MENNKKSKEMIEIEIEKETRDLVKKHVFCSASQMISELSELVSDVGFNWTEEMCSLMDGLVDYDASLEGSDIYINYVAGEGWYYGEELRSECDDCDQILQGPYSDRGHCIIDALEYHGIDSEHREIYEYWIMYKPIPWWLEERGAQAVELLDFHVGGQTTTGQPIFDDYTIKQIERMSIAARRGTK